MMMKQIMMKQMRIEKGRRAACAGSRFSQASTSGVTTRDTRILRWICLPCRTRWISPATNSPSSLQNTGIPPSESGSAKSGWMPPRRWCRTIPTLATTSFQANAASLPDHISIKSSRKKKAARLTCGEAKTVNFPTEIQQKSVHLPASGHFFCIKWTQKPPFYDNGLTLFHYLCG